MVHIRFTVIDLLPPTPCERGRGPGSLAWSTGVLLLALVVPTFSQAHVLSAGAVVSNSSWHDERFVHIAAGGLHTLGLRGDGSILGWGDNSGNMPEFSTIPHSGQCSAVPALPAGVSYVEIAAGYKHSVARRSDGAILKWGSTLLPGTVIQPPAGLSFVQVAAGGLQTLGLRSDGSILVLGSGLVAPVLPAGLTYVEIAAGTRHDVARRSDGSVVAWGDNSFGQCNVPVLPAGLSYVEIAAGSSHTVARRSDGSMVAWGDNSFGQCEVPALSVGLSYVEVSAGGALLFGGLSSGGFTVARRSDGSVVAWGDNSRGQCDVLSLPAGLGYVEIVAGGAHTAARRSDGSVVVWGDDRVGQHNAPALPTGLSYVEIAAGRGDVLARLSDGSVVGWGDDTYGQIDVPALPAGLRYVEIAASRHSVARRSDGSIVAWGNNARGQCDVPALPAGLTFVEITVGVEHTLARRSDGSVVGWGSNSFLQCDVPALPPGLSYTQIAAGANRSVACRSDGSIVTWGFDQHFHDEIPILPAGLSYVEVSTSGYNTLARQSDGRVVAWGESCDRFGQCDVPLLTPGLSYVELSAASSGFGGGPPTYTVSVARRSDGSVVSFGEAATYPYLQRLPTLLAGLSYVEIATTIATTYARFEPTPLALAPELARVTPATLDALIPGTARTVALSGSGLDATTSVALDGLAIDPARYLIVSSALILLDMPQASSLGTHELSVSDGLTSDPYTVTLLAPRTPRYELGTGDPSNVIERRDGFSYLLSGPVGSLQLVYYSLSSVPSTNAYASFGLGDNFGDMHLHGWFVIPAAGWLRVSVPASALSASGPNGLVFYSQALELSASTPFAISNLQSMQLVERRGRIARR